MSPSAEKDADVAMSLSKGRTAEKDVSRIRQALDGECDDLQASVLVPIVAELMAQAWDEGRRAERRDWEFTFDLSTPDEDRQPWTNPYRVPSPGE